MTENEALSGWIFAWQPFAKQWWAVKRDHYNDLWNWNGGENILKSDKFETLRELIIRTDGNKEKIDKLINNSSK